MNRQQRTRAMRKWDAKLRGLAHTVNELEDLEEAPLDEDQRWEREEENLALRMKISRALDDLREIEQEFPECRYWGQVASGGDR